MRQLKFRAWNTRLKEMEVFDDLYWFEENCVTKNGDYDFILMQYTGLKDKNGKEIYEGDIVTGDRQGTLDTVIFSSGCFCLERAMMHYEATYWGDEIEVKGNIYENPDLL